MDTDFTALISEFGIDKMPHEEQQKVFEQIFKLLQDRINARVSRILTEEQIKSLDEALERSPEDGIAELHRLVPDYDEMYQQEIDTLKADLKDMGL